MYAPLCTFCLYVCLCVGEKRNQLTNTHEMRCEHKPFEATTNSWFLSSAHCNMADGGICALGCTQTCLSLRF